MKVNDLILILTKTNAANGFEFPNIDGKIIQLSDSAIRVEWNDDFNTYRTWIPKSVIFIVQGPSENQNIDSYAVTLPDWFRVDVSTVF